MPPAPTPSAPTTPTGRPRLRRLAIGSLAVAVVTLLAMTACSPTEFLEVKDPDIIDPRDVQSAVGADGVRIGALARLNVATSGGESLFLLGGLFADEWNNGDSFIARQEIDQRVVTEANNFLTEANRALHRARLSAEQAIQLLAQYNPTAPAWQVAEMHFVQAYVVNLMAEHYCDGLVFSTVVEAREQYGTPITTAQAFQRALGHADDGLALTFGATANDVRVRTALRVLRGRILLNLNRPADAVTAVTGVPTTFHYYVRHSQTTQENAFWVLNNNARRYSVSTGEGTNGLNFATAADPRVPVCRGGDSACTANGILTGTGAPQTKRDDGSEPLYVQLLWPTRTDSGAIINGVEARLIEAEAQLAAGAPDAALATLNAARATVPGLLPLADAGTPAARQDQLFRERAFWLFGRGHRVGDMRRLIRPDTAVPSVQYGRLANTVFPVGAWHKGGNYGTDVNFPVPQAERNNPNLPVGPTTCMNRDP